MIRPDPKIQQIIRFVPKYFYALLGSAFLFTLGVLRSRHRFFVWQICRHFGWDDRPPVPLLPAVPAEKILDPQTAITLSEASPREGNVTTLELALLNGLVRRLQPATIFEIGTFDGRSSLNMLLNGPPQAQVYTLDLPPDQALQTALPIEKGDVHFIQKSESGERWKRHAVGGRIQQLFGDSASFDFSPYHGRMDFIFVDGSHAYEYVRNDTAVALALARPEGALIVWHDYDGPWPGVTTYLNELQARDPKFSALQRIEGTALAFCWTQPAVARKLFPA